MIKVALKHWIYELCLGQMFNSIHRNFSDIPRTVLDCLKVGASYDTMVYINFITGQRIDFHNVEIIRIEDVLILAKCYREKGDDQIEKMFFISDILEFK